MHFNLTKEFNSLFRSTLFSATPYNTCVLCFHPVRYGMHKDRWCTKWLSNIAPFWYLIHGGCTTLLCYHVWEYVAVTCLLSWYVWWRVAIQHKSVVIIYTFWLYNTALLGRRRACSCNKTDMLMHLSFYLYSIASLGICYIVVDHHWSVVVPDALWLYSIALLPRLRVCCC